MSKINDQDRDRSLGGHPRVYAIESTCHEAKGNWYKITNTVERYFCHLDCYWDDETGECLLFDDGIEW